MGVDFLQGRIEFLKEGDEALLREHLAALNKGCRILFAGAAAQGETASKMSMPAWAAAKTASEPFDGMTSDQKGSVWRRACDLRKTAKAGLKREARDLERRIAGLGKKIADEERKVRKEKTAKAKQASQAPTPFLKATAAKKGKPALPREAKIRALKGLSGRLKKRLGECRAELDAGKASICFGGKALARKLSWADAEGKAATRLAADLTKKIQASATPDPKLMSELAQAARTAQDAKVRGEALANEWRLRRDGGWTFEGKARSASRSDSAKLDPESKILRIRLTDALAEKRMGLEAERLGLSLSDVKSSPKLGSVRMACRFLEVAVEFGFGKGQAERFGKLSKILAIPKGGGDGAVPVSWRISAKLGPKGKLVWTAHAGWERPSPEIVSTKNAGALGVDLNARSAAWAFVDPDGNARSKARTKAEGKAPWFGRLPAAWGEGVSTDKTLSECRRLACELVEIASKRSCPIVMEALDFSRKKSSLRYEDPEHAAMLSGFAYSEFRKAAVSRAEKKGVEVLWADPAWSSVSGFFKFAHLGADPDEAAAVAIARSGLLARKSELRRVDLDGEPREASMLKERLPEALAKKVRDEADAKAKKAALRASKSVAKASAANTAATNNSGATNGNTSNSIKPRQPSGGTRRSTRTLGFEWKAGSEVLGKDRRLWRRRLSEFISESKILGGRPSGVPKAEARQSRVEAPGAGARPAEASSGPQGSKKAKTEGGDPPSTVFVNG